VPFDAGDIQSTLDLDRSPFTRGLEQARADAEKFEKRKITAKVDVDRSALERELAGQGRGQAKPIKIPVNLDRDELEKHLRQLGIKLPADLDQDALIRKIRSMASRKLIQLPAEVDQRSLIQAIDQIAANTEATARRSGNRVARALLNPVMIQLGLLPGIAAASALLAGGALAVLPLAFAAAGGAALKSNDDIKHSYKDLWEEVKADTKQAAQVLQPYGLEVARNLWGGFKTIEPQIRGIFAALGPQVVELSQGVVGLVTNLMPALQRSVQQSGPAVRGFSGLLRQLGTGLGQFFENISDKSVDIGRGLGFLGDIIQKLLGTAGQLLGTFATGWAQIGPQVSRVIDQLLSAVNGFVSGGMDPFVTTTKVAFGVLENILNVIGPLSGILGGASGWMLGAIVSWKLLSGSIGLAGKAWEMLAPATWATKLSGVSGRVDALANSMGNFVAKTANSEAAGSRFANAATKVGNAVTNSLKYIPLLGAAVAGAQAGLDNMFPSADKLAGAILQGGAASADAQSKIRSYSLTMGENSNLTTIWGQIATKTFASTSTEVQEAIRKQRESMTEMERKQQDVTIAQRDYQYAVDKFGEVSPEAISAQKRLAGATKDVESAQRRAAQATQTHIDKIIEETNLLLGSVGGRLNYKAQLLSLEQSQRDYAKATADAATATTDRADKDLTARQAGIAYQQQLLATVTALGERVKAENANLSPSEQSRLATLAEHQEIARLATVAGKDAPEALLELAAGLSDSELAAMGVTREVDNTGKAVYRLPPGKSLNFPTNAPIAQAQVQNLDNAISNLKPGKNLRFVIDVVTNQPGVSIPGLIIPRASGGPITKGQGYLVGEERKPELFFPDTDGFMLNGSATERLMSGDGGHTAWSPGGSGSDISPEQWVGMLVAALSMAFGQMRLKLDGQEWARLVNSVNTSNARR
jgi:hypothetical protein